MRLSKNDVLAIRLDPRPTSEVARFYDVSCQTIQRIKSGETYQKIKGPPSFGYIRAEPLTLLRSLPEGSFRGVIAHDEPSRDYSASIIRESLRAVGERGAVIFYADKPLLGWDLDAIGQFPKCLILLYPTETGENAASFPYRNVYLFAGDSWVAPKRHQKELTRWGRGWRLDPQVGWSANEQELARRSKMLVDGRILALNASKEARQQFSVNATLFCDWAEKSAQDPVIPSWL